MVHLATVSQVDQEQFRDDNYGNVRFLQLEPTTRCNYSCDFCARKRMNKCDLDLQTFGAILDRFPSLEHLELQGEGEPLLHPNFFEMVRYARARGAYVSLITNGSLLGRDDLADALLSSGVEHVLVSIDTVDPSTYAKLRKANVERVIDGVRTLMARRNERSLRRPRIGLNIIVMQSTFRQLASVLEVYRGLRLDGGAMLQPLMQLEKYVDIYPENIAEEHLSSARLSFVFASNIMRLRRTWAASGDPVIGFYPALYRAWQPRRSKCPWLESGAFVSVDGMITPCCLISASSSFGTVRYDEASTYFDKRRSVASSLAAGKVPPCCRKCPFIEMPRLTKAYLRVTGML